MSIERIRDFAEELPVALREDVLGYARSVRDALPDIFREAHVPQDQRLGDELVFLAGIKKLYAICSGTFWILDTSLQSLEQTETYEVRLGSTTVSRGSPEWKRLHDLLSDLETVLVAQGLDKMVHMTSYADILRRLRDER
jgi:hypothetical protein